MPERRLSTAEDIELVDQSFKNENHEAAAREILQFWDDGVDSFLEMGKRGEWSRTFYSEVFDEYFVAHWPDDPDMTAAQNMDVGDLPVDRETFMLMYQMVYPEIFNEGFRQGVKWAREDDE